MASDNPPPNKKLKADGDDEHTSDGEPDDPDDGTLVTLSDEASTFLEAAFNSKVDNTTRKGKAKAQGTPDSRWIRCAKIDPVMFVNISPAARTADRAVSRLQQFWLDAVNPLVFILEKAEEMNLPKEVIGGIQTSIQLMGNANFHNSAARRQALMTQLNPKLKQLFSGTDFKDAPPFLFGENFGVLAKECLEASEALRKSVSSDKGAGRGFQKSCPQRNPGHGGGYQSSSGQTGVGNTGWQAGNKAKKGLPKK